MRRLKQLVAGGIIGLLGGIVWGAPKASWSVAPAAPVYVGLVYELRLTIETALSEEVEELRLDQLPKEPPMSPVVEKTDDCRRTVYTWRQVRQTPRVESIPASKGVMTLKTMRKHGFNPRLEIKEVRVQVPAFAYEVLPLPAEAQGCLVGAFSVAFTTEVGDFAFGDVREVTAILRAEDGVIPDDFTFTWADAAAFPGRLYPFREVARSRTQLEARAWVVPSETAPEVQVALAPIRLFDARQHTVRALTAPPVVLRSVESSGAALKPAAEAEAKEVVLHFAPSLRSPVLGKLRSPWEVIERRAEWVLVSSADGEGWVPLEALEKERRP